eukprot:jgi/Psemu1/29748/gm1.29748_g
MSRVPAVLTQVEAVSDEASETVATTNIEVGVQAIPEGAATKIPAAHPKANPCQRKPSPTDEHLDYQKHWRSAEKNLGLALNGQQIP